MCVICMYMSEWEKKQIAKQIIKQYTNEKNNTKWQLRNDEIRKQIAFNKLIYGRTRQTVFVIAINMFNGHNIPYFT